MIMHEEQAHWLNKGTGGGGKIENFGNELEEKATTLREE